MILLVIITILSLCVGGIEKGGVKDPQGKCAKYIG